MSIYLKKLLYAFAFAAISYSAAIADEGMWTLDNLPIDKLKSDYKFEPTKEWLEHVRLSSVRFMNGGSGSLVSPNGLVMTNHHVGVDQIEKLSTKENDYVSDGFLARSTEEELKCPDLEVNILINMTNVTDKVKGAVKAGMSSKDALEARRDAIDKIEKDAHDKTGNRCDVVKLYNGGEYWLYEYKKYTDVRLVFAPEQQIAYFGGDWDNFTFPRYDLDISFFRIYEDGKPLQSKHYFKWSKNSVSENELVFMAGNPGTTERLKTYSDLLYKRDVSLQLHLDLIKTSMDALRKYSALGEEQHRRAKGSLFGLGNGLKVLESQLAGLKDPSIMAIKKAKEDEFRGLIAKNPDLNSKYMPAFDVIEQTIKKSFEKNIKFTYRNINSKIFSRALVLVRFITEKEKPAADRLPGYSDADLENLEFRILSPAPLYKDMDKFSAMALLEMNISKLGENDEYFKMISGGADIRQFVSDAIDKSKLDDQEFRKELIKGGLKMLKKTDDPALLAAMRVDEYMRKHEKEYREEFESVISEAREKIAEARFAVYGKSDYPDATFSFRLTYGAVKGYEMNGTIAPYKTTLYGLFDRSCSFEQKGDFALPKRFWEKQSSLDMKTPVNFVSTCDITGGNSGSPTFNRNAEIVGIVFDGNIESIVGNFVYDINKNRAVSVSSLYIVETMKKLYGAENLLKEMLEN